MFHLKVLSLRCGKVEIRDIIAKKSHRSFEITAQVRSRQRACPSTGVILLGTSASFDALVRSVPVCSEEGGEQLLQHTILSRRPSYAYEEINNVLRDKDPLPFPSPPPPHLLSLCPILSLASALSPCPSPIPLPSTPDSSLPWPSTHPYPSPCHVCPSTVPLATPPALSPLPFPQPNLPLPLLRSV